MPRSNDERHPAGEPTADTTAEIPSAEGLELARLREAARTRLFGPSGPPATVGRYRIIERIGTGGMGVVYLARDDALDRQVAVKLLRTATRSHGAARLVREAQAMAKLSHPNVAHVYEVGRQDDRVFIAMEYIPGPTLRAWNTGERPVDEVIAMHRQAGLGLAAAHEVGLVHRDYKPDNVLVDPKARARVLDFGLARPDDLAEPSESDSAQPLGFDLHRSWNRLTETGMVLGTPAYMSPEQLDEHRADARSDQFSFCVTLFEALYAERPFAGDTFATLRAAVLAGRRRPIDPADFGVRRETHAAIVRGLHVDPDARFPSMHALLEALDASAQPSGRPRWRRAATVGGLAAALGVGWATMWPRTDAPASAPSSAPLDPPRPPHAEILAASDLPDTLPEPLANDPYRLTIHRLDNGLTIYISPDHNAPTLAAAVVVRAGPIDERAGGTGAAHLLTHALSGGTARLGALDYTQERPLLERRDRLARELERTEDPERRRTLLRQIEQVAREAAPYGAPLEYAAILTAAGAVEHDSQVYPTLTMFHAELPSARLALWAQLEAERLRAPVFRNFFSALGPAAEKIREELDEHADVRALRRALFEHGPHANDALGLREDVERPPFSAVLDLHRRRYVPNNMAVVLVGNTDADTAVPIIEEAFGDWEPRAVAPRPTAPTPRPPGRSEHAGPPSKTPLVLAWPIHPSNRAACEDLLSVFDQELSRRPIANAIASGVSYDRISSSACAIGLMPESHASVDALESEAFRIIDDLRRLGPRPESLSAAHLLRRRRAIERRRDPVAMAETIAMSYGRAEPWARRVETERPAPISPSSVQRFARYMTESGFVALVQDPGQKVEPRFDVPVIGEIDHTAPSYSDYAQRLFAIPALQLDPQFILEGRHYRVDALGPTLGISTKTNDGLTTLSFVFQESRIAEHRLHATRLWMNSGTAKHSYEQRLKRWTSTGVSSSMYLFESWLVLDTTVLDENLDEAWPWISEWLAAPHPTSSSVERARESWQTIRQSARQDTRTTLLMLIRHAKDDPRAKDSAMMRVWSPRHPADEAAWSKQLAEMVERRPSVVLYSGAGEIPPLWDTDAPSPPPIQPYRGPRSEHPRVVAMDAPGTDRAQLQLVITRPALSTAEYVLADLLEAYLVSGEQALLQYALRISQPRSHWAAAWFDRVTTPEDDATFHIKLDVAPERVAEVIDLILESLQRPVTTEALAYAKSQLEAQYRGRRFEPSTIPSKVLEWRNAGFDRDPLLIKWPALAQVTVERLEAFKRTVVSENPPIIVVRGDLARAGRDRLERFGPVKVVDNDDLFGPD